MTENPPRERIRSGAGRPGAPTWVLALALAVGAAGRLPAPRPLREWAAGVGFGARAAWRGAVPGRERLVVVEIGPEVTAEDRLGPPGTWPEGLLGAVTGYLRAAGAASVVVVDQPAADPSPASQAVPRYPFDGASPARLAVDAVGGPANGWPVSPLDLAGGPGDGIEVRAFVDVLGAALLHQRLEARLDEPEPLTPGEARAFGVEAAGSGGELRGRLGERLARPDPTLSGRIVLVALGPGGRDHALAVAQLLAGRRILELPASPWLEAGIPGASAVLGAGLPAIGPALAPLAAVAAVAVALPGVTALGLLAGADVLVDPWGPTVALVLGLAFGLVAARPRAAGGASVRVLRPRSGPRPSPAWMERVAA